MMTNAYKISGARLPDKCLPIDSSTNGETCLQRVIAISRSEAVTANRCSIHLCTTSWNRAILPAKGTAPRRVMESTAAHVLTPRAIVGRTRQAQRARCRTGRAGRLLTPPRPAASGRPCGGVRPGAWRAVDESRPGALGNAARGELCYGPNFRPSRTRPHPCSAAPCAEQGWGAPTHQRSHREVPNAPHVALSRH